MHKPLALAAFLALFCLASPEIARAGGCEPCTTSAECVASTGAPAFCISWDDMTGGCASTPIQCCPGQGCDTFSGRPSCEASGRCHVIDDPDAGPSTGPDAAVGADAASGTDAGTSSGTDAGTSSAMDAGTTGGARGGCACHAARGADHADAIAWLGLMAAVVTGRRLTRAPR